MRSASSSRSGEWWVVADRSYFPPPYFLFVPVSFPDLHPQILDGAGVSHLHHDVRTTQFTSTKRAVNMWTCRILHSDEQRALDGSKSWIAWLLVLCWRKWTIRNIRMEFRFVTLLSMLLSSSQSLQIDSQACDCDTIKFSSQNPYILRKYEQALGSYNRVKGVEVREFLRELITNFTSYLSAGN